MYDKILMPVEGEDHEDKILRHSVEHARNHDSELQVTHITEESMTSRLRSNDGENHSNSLHSDGSELSEVLSEISKEIPNDVDDRYVELSGDPAYQITEYVSDEGIDLIVMGTHGRKGVQRVLLGSVAEKVVRSSNPPVLIVPLSD